MSGGVQAGGLDGNGVGGGVGGGIVGRNDPEVEEASLAPEAAEEKPSDGFVSGFEDPAGVFADGTGEEVSEQLRGAERGPVGVAGGEEGRGGYGLAGCPGVMGGEGAELPAAVPDGAGDVFGRKAIGAGAKLGEGAERAGIDGKLTDGGETNFRHNGTSCL